MTYGILLVEDEKWVRIALRKIIEKLKIPFTIIHEATNGMEASDWLQANEADLILTDIRMPVMDGLTLLREVKRIGSQADVIIVSGHDDFAYAQEALRQGAYDYFLKPVEAADIQNCFLEWMEKREREEVARKPENGSKVQFEELSPVEQVIHHMEANQAMDMTLAEAAGLVHLNPSYFCKLFKQHTATTFTDYVTNVRMKEAARLLENTSLRITEIAERLGYSDPAYFSNTFKKTIGQTPSDYRKQPIAES
jgi:YesN/AraC family two-component response regulator